MDGGIILEREPGYDLTEEKLGHKCAELLGQHYPGWTWRVNLNTTEKGNVALFENVDLNEATHNPWGVQLFMTTLYSDPDLKCVVKSGGAILEFAGLPHKKNDGYEIDTTVYWSNYKTWKEQMAYGMKH